MSRKLDMEFGDRLRQAAEGLGIPYKQTPIADYLEVRKQNVDAWMNGSLPRSDQLFIIADKLKVDPRWLATGKRGADAGNNIPSPKAEKLLAAIKILMNTDERGLEEILAAVPENGTTRQQRNGARRPRSS